MLSAICFNLDQSKSLLSGNGLKHSGKRTNACVYNAEFKPICGSNASTYLQKSGKHQGLFGKGLTNTQPGLVWERVNKYTATHSLSWVS